MRRVLQIAAVVTVGAIGGFVGREFLLSDDMADSTITRRSNSLQWTEYRVTALADGGVAGVVCGSVSIVSSFGATETETSSTNVVNVTGARATAAKQLGDTLAARLLPQALKLEANDGGTL